MNSQPNPLVVLQRVRDSLNARGTKTIRSLGVAFRTIDSYDGNRKVDKDEFLVGLQEMGVQINKSEAYSLLDYLDTNKDGSLNFDEFLIAIRGKMNSRRQAITDKAFLKFDKDGSGSITAADLRGVYNCSAHPKVQKGEMTEDQVFIEFLQHFGDTNKDGTLSRTEWNDYYNAVSASIDNDDHFVELMKTCWKL